MITSSLCAKCSSAEESALFMWLSGIWKMQAQGIWKIHNGSLYNERITYKKHFWVHLWNRSLCRLTHRERTMDLLWSKCRINISPLIKSSSSPSETSLWNILVAKIILLFITLMLCACKRKLPKFDKCQILFCRNLFTLNMYYSYTKT